MTLKARTVRRPCPGVSTSPPASGCCCCDSLMDGDYVKMTSQAETPGQNPDGIIILVIPVHNYLCIICWRLEIVSWFQLVVREDIWSIFHCVNYNLSASHQVKSLNYLCHNFLRFAIKKLLALSFLIISKCLSNCQNFHIVFS